MENDSGLPAGQMSIFSDQPLKFRAPGRADILFFKLIFHCPLF